MVRDSRGVKCGIILRCRGGAARPGPGDGDGDGGGERGVPLLCGVPVQRFDAFDDALEFLLEVGGRGQCSESRGEELSNSKVLCVHVIRVYATLYLSGRVSCSDTHTHTHTHTHTFSHTTGDLAARGDAAAASHRRRKAPCTSCGLQDRPAWDQKRKRRSRTHRVVPVRASGGLIVGLRICECTVYINTPGYLVLAVGLIVPRQPDQR